MQRQKSTAGTTTKNIHANPKTTFAKQSVIPNIAHDTAVHPTANVIGNVIIASGVNIAPEAVIRGDEGSPIYIGKNSNVQDQVIVHGLKGKYVNEKGINYSVYVGEHSSLAHQSQVHGPAKIGNNVFVGMQALVFKSEIQDGVVIEPAAKIIGVKIPSGKYVPAGEVIKTQSQVDNLPDITEDYKHKHMNEEVIEVNRELAEGYLAQLGHRFSLK